MILENIDWAIKHCQHVHVDEPRLAQVCNGLDPAQLRLPDWRVPVVPRWRDERLMDFFLLFNTINFCYWGEPKWTVSFRGQDYDGAFGMMAALTRAVEDEGLPLFDGAFLAGISDAQFRHILRGNVNIGNVAIPLEDERLAIWRQVGPVLAREFGGRWHNVVRRAAGNAVRLVELLTEFFPSFDDAVDFYGRRVSFHKRAQLAAGMIYQAFGGQGLGAFDDFGQLTAYADYKLPQVLRKLGILVYDEELATLVDGQVEIPAGGAMEVEIRAATVWAVDLMRHALSSLAPAITAGHIDFWLWQTSQTKHPDDRPYHRTQTTAY